MTVAENNATIQLRNDNFTSNFTIAYGLCSEDSRTPKPFESPVVHLENLIANTTYCYSITSNGNDLVSTTCSGMFTTATETTPTTQPTTSDGNYIVVVNVLNKLCVCKKEKENLLNNIQHIILENLLLD